MERVKKVTAIWGKRKKKIHFSFLVYTEHVEIPVTPQGQIFKQLHLGPLEILRMKSPIRSYVHCPRMDVDIENLGKSCKNYAKAAKLPPIKI